MLFGKRNEGLTDHTYGAVCVRFFFFHTILSLSPRTEAVVRSYGKLQRQVAELARADHARTGR